MWLISAILPIEMYLSFIKLTLSYRLIVPKMEQNDYFYQFLLIYASLHLVNSINKKMVQMLRNESSGNVVIDKMTMMNNCAQWIPGFHIYISKKNEELRRAPH